MFAKLATAGGILCMAVVCAHADEVDARNSLGNVSKELSAPVAEDDSISIVREKVLRETAQAIGARAGLFDRSCEIDAVLRKRAPQLDKQFRFGALMMGQGMLPPVISEARDTVSYSAQVMRVASRAYHIDQPAMLVDTPPTWRTWLHLGLTVEACDKPFAIPEIEDALRPKTDQERKFFNAILKASYSAGRDQAQHAFNLNLATLERTYIGMRRYFELYERGMVSAPVLVSDTEIVAMDDPNTMLVGNTVIRISGDARFVATPDKWKPLAQ